MGPPFIGPRAIRFKLGEWVSGLMGRWVCRCVGGSWGEWVSGLMGRWVCRWVGRDRGVQTPQDGSPSLGSLSVPELSVSNWVGG